MHFNVNVYLESKSRYFLRLVKFKTKLIAFSFYLVFTTKIKYSTDNTACSEIQMQPSI